MHFFVCFNLAQVFIFRDLNDVEIYILAFRMDFYLFISSVHWKLELICRRDFEVYYPVTLESKPGLDYSLL